MSSFLTHHRRRILVTMAFLSLFMAGLCGQLGYLMIFRSEHYSTMAVGIGFYYRQKFIIFWSDSSYFFNILRQVIKVYLNPAIPMNIYIRLFNISHTSDYRTKFKTEQTFFVKYL